MGVAYQGNQSRSSWTQTLAVVLSCTLHWAWFGKHAHQPFRYWYGWTSLEGTPYTLQPLCATFMLKCPDDWWEGLNFNPILRVCHQTNPLGWGWNIAITIPWFFLSFLGNQTRNDWHLSLERWIPKYGHVCPFLFIFLWDWHSFPGKKIRGILVTFLTCVEFGIWVMNFSLLFWMILWGSKQRSDWLTDTCEWQEERRKT